jgi:dolichyl-diphosphooligosaccharide--protein glycosyltransferase
LAEEGKSPARLFLSKFKRGDGRPGEFRKWITASWPTLLMLLFIFVLALFVRSYFGYPTAHDNGNLVSGGSDSYYWQRIIDYSAQTGKQLYHDPMLNFPDGIRNPRPPMFSMSVVVPAILAQHGFPSLDEALGMFLLWTPAFWGALTVIPTYMLGKETFGRRAGLAAAFLLAVTPSHVQRSVLSGADHDSFILFFIVLMLFFLLKAFKAQESRKWVDSWGNFASIKAGLKEYFRSNRTAMLYAAMAGVAYSAVIMTWVGFGYVTVLVLIYYVVQVLLNKVKSLDSMSVTIIIAITMGLGFFLSFPVYFYQSLVATRFDVPFYLFLVSIVFGGIFVITRDHPWTVTFPMVGIILGIAIFAINLVNPSLVQLMLTGEGYFSTSKLYSTIAEAKAPVFSELALGFGMITFFMSLTGLVWAVMKIPKNTTARYIFITVWLVEAIFMAMTSARFMFNATPAFAIAAGWILIMVIDKLDFNTMRKTIAGASGSYLHIMRKNVKVRHVIGALFLAFMIVLPNVWYSVDAGIPAETKTHLDKEIYLSLPKVLRPSGYDVANGSNWYLGAFGYSLPLPKFYFPAAWSWFASQDANITPAAAKPAFVAWWDYGFEAIDAGLHPTVADNFQNGYQITGNAIMAQSEADAVAVFAYRIIQVGMSKGAPLETGITSILERYGVNSTQMHDILFGPAEPVIKTVLSDAAVYGPMSPDLGAVNARIVAARVALTSIGMDSLVSLYGDLVDLTGWDIRYFMVDSRMFPSSGQSTGIFYAPAKLADRRMKDSSPIDFFDVQAVTSTGLTIAIENLTAEDTVTDYKLIYKDMFYNSMFYRAFSGYTGADVGLTNDGIPGLSGSVSQYPAMPGWNLTHFMQVYRTAYYNPFPAAEMSEHRDDWTAMSYDQAEALKAAISAGTATGVVDDSAYTFYGAGASFLEYYKGAYVNGTLTTEQGYPVGGIRVTIQDKYSIPHGSVFTDANGHYSLLAPPGTDTLTFSSGDARNPTLVGTTEIKKMILNITDNQSMRVHEDMNNDGILDYIITKDFAMKGTLISGTIFWDVDLDQNYTEGTDQLFVGSQTVAREQFTNRTMDLNTSEGAFEFALPPGRYDFNVLANEMVMSMGQNVNATAGGQAKVKLPIEPGVVKGTARYPDGSAAANTTLRMLDLDVNFPYSTITNSSGGYSFDLLIAGNYSMGTNASGKTVFNTFLSVEAGKSVEKNVTVFPAAKIDYTILNGGKPVGYAAWMLSDIYDPSNTVSGIANEFGLVELNDAPRGLWSLYVTYHSGTADYAASTLIDTRTADSAASILSLRPAVRVSADVTNVDRGYVTKEYVNFEMPNGARVSIKTGSNGRVTTILPLGTYNVTITSVQDRGVFSGTATVSAQQTGFSFVVSGGAKVAGTLMMVRDAIAGISSEDIGRLGNIRITDLSGRTFLAKSAFDGSFSIIVPTNIALKISLGNPGYSRWSTTVQFAQGSTGYTLIARPDNVTVSGVVTNQSLGLRGVTVAFLPSSFLGTPVYAITGPGGVYSASVPSSQYSVVVNQNSDLMGAERYMSSAQQRFLPSGVVQVFDIQTAKKVEVFGSIVGGSSGTKLNFQGPEQKTVSISTLNYSVYMLPGKYDIYATSTVTGTTYANVSSVSLTATSRQHDLELTRAHALQGVATIATSSTDKTVTVQVTASSGAVVKTTSTSLGFYSLQLPSGSYTVKYSREDNLAMGGHNLFVEYFAQLSVTIDASDVTVSPNLAMRLDNATLSGTVIGPAGVPEQATISLIPNTNFGEPTSFTTDLYGAFNQSVQPGDYTIYVTNQVDRTAALSRVILLRKVETQGEIPLLAASYMNVRAQVAGAGAQVTFSLSNSSMRMQIPTDPQGDMQILLPPANYSLSATTFRTENTLNITYSISKTVSLGDVALYETLDFIRGTSRSVVTSWSRSLEQTAAPGQEVNYVFTVENTGNVADTYIITFIGSGFNVSFSSSRVNLDFGVNNRTTIVASVTPTKEVAAGEQLVSTLVRSNNLATLRSNLALYVNVIPFHEVKITNLNAAEAVTSTTTVTKFNVTNMGSVTDTYILQISNEAILESLGWKAVIVDPSASGNVTTNVTLLAFSSSMFEVKFTSTRTDADPTVHAIVLAYLKNASYVSTTGPIPVILPDIVLPPGSLRATGPNIAYEYDMMPLYTDMGLLVAIAVLMAMFFILRKKKGFGGAKK